MFHHQCSWEPLLSSPVEVLLKDVDPRRGEAVHPSLPQHCHQMLWKTVQPHPHQLQNSKVRLKVQWQLGYSSVCTQVLLTLFQQLRH